MSRFDYVRYDKVSQEQQAQAKQSVRELEDLIFFLNSEPSIKNALTQPAQHAMQHLEECYMWIGKMVRDSQAGRGGCKEDVTERG